MKHLLSHIATLSILSLGLLAVAACTPAQLTQVQAAEAKVASRSQLYCGIATTAGPLVVALVNAAGVPVAATDVAKADVDFACGLAQGIPVAPPASGTVVPVVAVPGPVATVPIPPAG